MNWNDDVSAQQKGAERIIAMSRHEQRQKLAREFGATDIVAERGDEGVKRIVDMTKGIGADSVLECIGTQQSMMQAIRCTRKGGYASFVGVPHGVELNGEELFFAHEIRNLRRKAYSPFELAAPSRRRNPASQPSSWRQKVQ